jgi:hypothetical protein
LRALSYDNALRLLKEIEFSSEQIEGFFNQRRRVHSPGLLSSGVLE